MPEPTARPRLEPAPLAASEPPCQQCPAVLTSRCHLVLEQLGSSWVPRDPLHLTKSAEAPLHSLSSCSRRIPWHRQLAGTATPTGMARLAPSPWRAGGSERLPHSPAAAPSTSCPALGWPLQPWLLEQHLAIEQMCCSGPGIQSLRRCCILLAELLHAGGRFPCPCLPALTCPYLTCRGKAGL